MHLHIFRDEFSRLNRENFHCKAMKSLVKIYANACICIYFKRADVANEYNKPFVVIPYKLGHPNNISNNYLKQTNLDDGAYIKELEGSSWVSPCTRIAHTILSHKYETIFIIIIILIICFIWLKSRKKISTLIYYF